MMFNFKIENYRSFKENEFKFSKINILIGENSSGKSSLMKLLLALKQTLQHPVSREINLAFTGEFANLGSYRDAVYYHNDQLPITFSFEFGKDYYTFFNVYLKEGIIIENQGENSSNTWIKTIHGSNLQSTTLTFTVTNELDKHETIQTQLQNDAIGSLKIIHPEKQPDPESVLLFGQRCNIEYYDNQLDSKFIFEDIEFQKEGFMSLIIGQTLIPQIDAWIAKKGIESGLDDKLRKFEITSRMIFERMAFLLVSQNYLKFRLDRIDYVNPINTNPSRVYLYKDEKHSNAIKDIEDVVNYFSRSNDASKKELQEFIGILQKCGIAEEIEVISDSRLPVRELRVKVKDLVSNIMDVGYGVSLQLPILLKAWVSERSKKKNSTIFIEQPEVHLHPKLHAQLIETLISLSSQTNYFIETHSEHIIRKLQVLIKEGKYGLKPNDVTIYYLRRDKKKSDISCHKINENGFLNPPFPSGFFDNSYLLSKELLD